MEKKYIIGAGLVVLGLFAYSRYAKKDESGQQEEQGGGGGGIGGGGFSGGLIIEPITNQPTTPRPASQPTTPRPASQGRSYTASEVTKSKDTTPTAATTSSTGAGAQSGVTMPSGGIKPVVRTGSSSTSSSGIGNTGVGVTNTGNISGVGSTMTGTAGGTVFKPFDGCEPNRRRTLFLNDLVRSWNRP
jgi:hypothetical protein